MKMIIFELLCFHEEGVPRNTVTRFHFARSSLYFLASWCISCDVLMGRRWQEEGRLHTTLRRLDVPSRRFASTTTRNGTSFKQEDRSSIEFVSTRKPEWASPVLYLLFVSLPLFFLSSEVKCQYHESSYIPCLIQPLMWLFRRGTFGLTLNTRVVILLIHTVWMLWQRLSVVHWSLTPILFHYFQVISFDVIWPTRSFSNSPCLFLSSSFRCVWRSNLALLKPSDTQLSNKRSKPQLRRKTFTHVILTPFGTHGEWHVKYNIFTEKPVMY